ncbi:MAG TPA: histidine kinase [Desulfobacteraceae bacterium]|nr:histidine kinase [Desulfobacteraceae bacterium]
MSANKILIVDDEQIIVRLLSMSLRSDGYDVVSANNGEEALAVLEKEAPDIVVTDIKMPVMDGLELLKRIKETDPDKEVIIVTGHGDIDSTIVALQHGASDFINKPVRDEALAIALDRAKTKIHIREQLAGYTKNLEQKVAEATEEIRRKSNFQQLLIHSSHDAIVAFDQDWKIVVFNPEAARIFGQTAGDVLNKMTIEELYPADLVARFKDEAQDDTRQKKNTGDIPWKEMTLKVCVGCNFPVRYATSVLHENGEFVGIVNFFQDLTEIKRLEKELVQSERLAAVGQTVSGLAHYVKNILIGLKGGSYVVDVGIKKNNTDKLKTGWQTIKKNIGRVSDLTQDLLTYSKEREPELAPCFPGEIVADVASLVTDTAAAKGIEIVSEVDPGLGEVTADPQTIHRALLNLVNNAMDACLEDEDTSKDFQVRIRAAAAGSDLLLIVEDNGCGMTEETMSRLFDPMFSTKGGKGTGLGLLVTGKLVEEHKGRIETESELGKGTRFKIILPAEPVADADKKPTKEDK